MPVRDRPTSPHWQIYRWQVGNTLSILHRLTGIALAFGSFALCYWLMSMAGGIATYRIAMRLLASPVGLAALMGWIFAFLFHLLNGVRHLFWDFGAGFERRQRHASGWFAAFGALALTLCVWLLIRHHAP